MRRFLGVVAVVVLGLPSIAYAQANGKLQIHFMDVGQGDGAVLISPQGEIVLFDDGARASRQRARFCDGALQKEEFQNIRPGT